MLKKLPAVCVGLLLTLSVFAATVELNEHHPDTYTVQKGDTLWTISARFLKRPWEWPEVWQANPQIRNPHLIYPGDVINLAYLDGRARLSVSSQDSGSGPRVHATSLDEAVKPVPLSEIEAFLKKPRIISEEDFRSAPHIVAFEDHHLNGTTGQLAYVRGLDASAGQQFALLRPLGRYYEVTSDGAPTRLLRESMEDRDDRPDMLWHDGVWNFSLHGDVHFVGYEMLQFGTVQVTKGGNPASTLIITADVEVRTGDYVMPLDTTPYDFQYLPHPPPQVPAGMGVIAFADALNAAGRLQVVTLSSGARDGVENGQVYSIFTPGDVAIDRTDYPEMSAKAFFHPHDAEVQLPEEYIAHLIIFRTFERVSYGLIMDGIRPVHVGDHLYEPDHR